MGESDEFDINVVINLPFDETHVTLNYDDSSPSYALVEIPEKIVKSFELGFDMFAEKDGAFHISAQKLDQHLNMAVNMDLNMLNNSGGNGGLSKKHLDFSSDLFTNFFIYKSDEGWTSIHDTMKFKVDLVCCIHLPLSALENHPIIPSSLKSILRVFPGINFNDDIVRLVPKTSPLFLKSSKSGVNLRDQQHTQKLQVSDWVLGLGSIENKILQQFETPILCLMLLKYLR